MKNMLINAIQSHFSTTPIEAQGEFGTPDFKLNADDLCKNIGCYQKWDGKSLSGTGQKISFTRWDKLNNANITRDSRILSKENPYLDTREVSDLLLHLSHEVRRVGNNFLSCSEQTKEQVLQALREVREVAISAIENRFFGRDQQFTPGWVPSTEEAFLQAFTSICDLRRQSTALQQQVKVLEAKAKRQENRLDDVEGLFTCPPDWSDTTTYICNRLGLPTRKFGAVIINGHCCHGPSSAGRYIASLWRDEMGTEPRTHHCANSRETYKIYPLYFLKVFEIKLPAWVKEAYTGDDCTMNLFD